MARPLRIEFPNAFYHVYSRGNERKAIFRDEEDYESLLSLMNDCCDLLNVRIHSFCFMPNHFHMLIETKDANLSTFMKRLLGVYTTRFNRRHKRVGHLFQGRYKAILVDKDAYLLPLSRYIHLNPLKAKLLKDPRKYIWSSLRYFSGKEKPPACLETSLILSMFRSNIEYVEYVLDDSGIAIDPLKEAVGGLVLGTNEFFDKFRGKISSQTNPRISNAKTLIQKVTENLEEIIRPLERDLQIYCLFRIGRRSQADIGKIYEISYSAVSHIIRKVERKALWKMEFEEIKSRCSIFKN